MNFIPAWLWFIAGILLLIAELLTPTFFLGIVGVGALVASLADLLFGTDVASLLVFVLASGGAAYLAWRYDIYSRSEETYKSGTDRLLNKEGRVTEPIDPSMGTGVVQVEGEKWRAKSQFDEVIPEGSKVVIGDIQGTTLVVWQADQSAEQEV